MGPKHEKEAVFWCTLLHDVIFMNVDENAVGKHLRSLADKEVVFPNGKKKKPSLSTLKRKLVCYQAHGLSGIMRKSRSDRGKARQHRAELIDKAVEIKRDQPKRSAATVNQFLKAHNDTTVPRSTLYRHLKQHGATRLKLGVVQKKVRCRWTRDASNELWIGDFQDGPFAFVDGEVLQTSLCLFIDCHSRFVVEGRYYLRKSLDILIDSLLRAWTVYGIPQALYVDNAKVYHSHALKAACYAMRIELIHRSKGDPAPGGLVERLFGTNQSQFEAEVRAGDLLPFDTLNRAFSAWLAVSYHDTLHSETQQTPHARYHQGPNKSRSVDMDQAILFFMRQEERTVNSDFSDVAIHNRFYRVHPQLRGDRVVVRYDPFSSVDTVLIYSPAGLFLGVGTPHHREKTSQSEPSTPLPKPKHNYIDLILSQHERRIAEQAKGIDYIKLTSSERWPFAAFLQTLASLMGKKGGTSAFSSDEVFVLKQIYTKHPSLTRVSLEAVFSSTPITCYVSITTLGQLALALQTLNKE